MRLPLQPYNLALGTYLRKSRLFRFMSVSSPFGFDLKRISGETLIVSGLTLFFSRSLRCWSLDKQSLGLLGIFDWALILTLSPTQAMLGLELGRY